MDFLGDGMNSLTFWSSSGASNSNSEELSGSKPGPSRKLTAEDELLLVLTRLRVRMVEQDLAVPFELSQSHVCDRASQAKFRQKSSTSGDSFPHGSPRRKY